jgi:hypothetical protein
VVGTGSWFCQYRYISGLGLIEVVARQWLLHQSSFMALKCLNAVQAHQLSTFIGGTCNHKLSISIIGMESYDDGGAGIPVSLPHPSSTCFYSAMTIAFKKRLLVPLNAVLLQETTHIAETDTFMMSASRPFSTGR